MFCVCVCGGKEETPGGSKLPLLGEAYTSRELVHVCGKRVCVCVCVVSQLPSLASVLFHLTPTLFRSALQLLAELAKRPLCELSGTCDFDDETGVYIPYTLEDAERDASAGAVGKQ